VYSSVVSAFLVGFLWDVDLCVRQPPTLHFDLVVDSFFMLEIFLTFITGTHIAGDYIDDWQTVNPKP